MSMKFALAAGAVAVCAMTGASNAQVQTQRDITWKLGLAIAEGAIEECAKTNVAITVAVVDRAGRVRVFIAPDNPSPHNFELARRKAYTARTFRQATSQWMERTAIDAVDEKGKPIDLNGQQMLENTIAQKGGMPIIWHGDAIGGVGVAGSKGGGEADETCAKAGVDAIADQLF